MSEGKTPRSERIDQVLAAWPEPERSKLEWDESVAGVMAKLDSGAVSTGVSDEDLFAAPLPASPEEVQGSAPIGKGEAGMTTSMPSSKRDRAHLKDLAKMADMSPPSSQPNSGVFAEARRASQPPAEERVEREENSGLIQLAALAEGEAKQAATSAPANAAAAPRAAQSKKGSTNWLMLGGMVAAAAVALGVFVGMRGQAPMATPAVAVAAPPAATDPVAAPLNPATKPVVAPIAATDKGIDPLTLPPADTGGAGGTPAPGAKPAVVAAAGPAVAATATAPAAPDPKLVAVVPSAAAPVASAGSDQSLHDLMQQAAGTPPSATTVTAPDAPLASPGSVPLKPSQGAISGALGAALPGARACLGPDDPISRATVTFQSDGSVQSVSVSGGAAGKAAEGCIRAALVKARVQPFAQATYSASTTIRAN